MPIALFTVKATMAPDREKAFNEWCNHEHIPDVFKFKGVVSARRYKATAPEYRFQYVTMHEFESEETLERSELRRRGLRAPAGQPRPGLALTVRGR